MIIKQLALWAMGVFMEGDVKDTTALSAAQMKLISAGWAQCKFWQTINFEGPGPPSGWCPSDCSAGCPKWHYQAKWNTACLKDDDYWQCQEILTAKTLLWTCGGGNCPTSCSLRLEVFGPLGTRDMLQPGCS